MKKLLILFVLATTIGATAQQSVLLRFNYTKGDVYKTDMTVTQNMGKLMSNTTKVSINQKIMSVSDTLFTAEMKIDKMSMDMVQGGKITSFDSTKKAADLDESGKMIKTQVDPILNAKFISKGTNLGKIIDLKVEPNVPGAEQMVDQSNSIVYPKKAVKVGDDWNMKKSQKGMDFNFTYKVIEITAKNVKLNVTGTVGGMATGTISGNMIIERKSGISSKSTITMKMGVAGQQMVIDVDSKMVKM
ncbi:MAG: DUF6263 family protein [Polaribacter sp.]